MNGKIIFRVKAENKNEAEEILNKMHEYTANWKYNLKISDDILVTNKGNMYGAESILKKIESLLGLFLLRHRGKNNVYYEKEVV